MTAKSETAEARRTIRDHLSSWFRRVPDPYGRILDRLIDRELLLTASSLAFYGLVSALPLLLISFSVIQGVVGPEALQDLGQQAANSEASGAQKLIQDVARAADSPGWWVYVIVLWPSTAYGGGLRRALQASDDDPDDERLSGLKGRGLGLLFVLILPMILLGGIPLMYWLSRLGGEGVLGTLTGVAVSLVAGTVAGTVINVLLYQVFTEGTFAWKRVLHVAVIVAFATSVMSWGFVLYLQVASLEERYGSGALALVVLLGIWLLALNILLLAGYHALIELRDAEDDADGKTDSDATSEDDARDEAIAAGHG